MRSGKRYLQDRTLITFLIEDGTAIEQQLIGRPYREASGNEHQRYRSPHQPGEKITIRYLPENPNDYEIGTGSSQHKGTAALYLGFILGVLAALSLGYLMVIMSLARVNSPAIN